MNDDAKTLNERKPTPIDELLDSLLKQAHAEQKNGDPFWKMLHQLVVVLHDTRDVARYARRVAARAEHRAGEALILAEFEPETDPTTASIEAHIEARSASSDELTSLRKTIREHQRAFALYREQVEGEAAQREREIAMHAKAAIKMQGELAEQGRSVARLQRIIDSPPAGDMSALSLYVAGKMARRLFEHAIDGSIQRAAAIVDGLTTFIAMQ